MHAFALYDSYDIDEAICRGKASRSNAMDRLSNAESTQYSIDSEFKFDSIMMCGSESKPPSIIPQLSGFAPSMTALQEESWRTARTLFARDWTNTPKLALEADLFHGNYTSRQVHKEGRRRPRSQPSSSTTSKEETTYIQWELNKVHKYAMKDEEGLAALLLDDIIRGNNLQPVESLLPSKTHQRTQPDALEVPPH
jgi:hypothetical protein